MHPLSEHPLVASIFPHLKHSDSLGAEIDKLRPYGEAAKLVDVHLATLHRWGMSGCRRDDGNRCKLKSTRFGGRRYTSIAAVAEFFDALGRGAGDGGSRQSEDGPSLSRLREIMAADLRVQAAGA